MNGQWLRERICPPPKHEPATPDLTQNTALTLHLMATGAEWRERHVEEVVFGAGHHARVRSTYQFRLRRSLLDPYVSGRPSDVKVLLPVATREKRPLLGFDITTSTGAPAHLIRRGDGGVIEAAYLEGLAEEAGIAPLCRALPAGLLSALARFSPGMYEQYRGEYRYHPVEAYVAAGLRRPGTVVTVDDVSEWTARLGDTGETIVEHMEEKAADYSSAENVLLALTAMHDPPRPGPAVEAAVDAYAKLVAAAARAGAGDFLSQLGEYGRRYELLVEVEVPVDDAFTITVSEDRPLQTRLHPRPPRWRRARSIHFFALNDAGSAHLELRSVDHTVRIRNAIVRTPTGRELSLGTLEAERATEETMSIYSSIESRPELAHVEVWLALTRSAKTLAYGLTTVLVAATALASALDEPAPNADAYESWVARLALLAVPTTFAATLVLTREESALARRLQVPHRLVLAILTAALLAVVFARIATPLPPQPETSSAAPRGTITE